MPEQKDYEIAEQIGAHVNQLMGGPLDFDPLLDMIGDSRFVLMGESTHGTHDFYRIRAELSKRLIKEKDFVHRREIDANASCLAAHNQ